MDSMAQNVNAQERLVSAEFTLRPFQTRYSAPQLTELEEHDPLLHSLPWETAQSGHRFRSRAAGREAPRSPGL